MMCRGEDGICSLNIPEMLAAGLPDDEVLTAWLTDLHFEASSSIRRFLLLKPQIVR